MGSCKKQPPIPKDATKEVFQVSGNCGMCEETIEGACKKDGVYKSSWDQTNKSLEVYFDPNKISLDSIQKSIAEAGYDNDKYRGNDEAYANLPECCQYDRK